MKKTQIIKTLMIAVFIAASTSSSSSAEYVTSPGSTFFQQVVLMHERSPDMNIQVNRISEKKATVNVTSSGTGKPIKGANIFSMTNDNEVFLLGETNSKGSLNFEDGYKHVMQLKPRGGYRQTEKFHVTGNIDLIITMTETESSVSLFNRTKQFINSQQR